MERFGGHSYGLLSAVAFALMFCIGRAEPVAAADNKEQLHRLVVVVDPEVAGESTANVASRVHDAARGSERRNEMGNPARVRLLMGGARDQEMIQRLSLDQPESRLQNAIVLEFDDEPQLYRAVMTLLRDPRVARVSVGARGTFSSDPLVPIVSGQPGAYQWGLYATNVITAADPLGVWARTRGNAYVAVLDNGIKTAGGVHEDLVGSYRPLFSQNFGYLNNGPNGDPTTPANLDETPFPAYNYAGHGTHVAGLIAASNSNSAGGAGVCPGCSLFAARIGVFVDGPPPSFAPDFQVFDQALVTMARRGAQVVNLSFGSTTESIGTLPDVHDALLLANARDVFVVAASGNLRTTQPEFPANVAGLATAVGGLEAVTTSSYQFWNGTGVPGDFNAFGSAYSTSSTHQQFVAPATKVQSSTYTGLDWNPFSPYDCGDTLPTVAYPGYGQCQGTSMAAPHLTGIVALMRSVNPLLNVSTIREMLVATSNGTHCNDPVKCQLGVPDAAAAVVAALGGSNVLNRTTPLFSFYSTTAQNHFYSVVPQMAMSAMYAGDLLPQPASGTLVRYDPIGSTLSAYGSFPANTCGPGACSSTPKAIALVYSTHVSPTGGADLLPIYRMSYRCGDELLTTPPNASNPACGANPNHISHFYSTDEVAVRVYTGYYANGVKDVTNPGLGYRLDGVEGFAHSPAILQPSGTVKLCRKYDPLRDDYVLFPGVGTGGLICTGTSDGYTGGSYTGSVGGTDWIGWVVPASATVGPSHANNLPSVSITGPANNSVFSQGANTTVYVTASDSDGSIARVRVFANDKLIGTDTSTPFQIAWNGMQSGGYVVRAIAVDNRGAIKTSATRVVTVNGGSPPSFPNNGGFEVPDLAGGTYVTNPSGSQFTWSPVSPTGQSGITENNSAFNTYPGFPPQLAPNGTQVAFVQGEKIVEKQLLFPFGTYKIKFKAAQRRQNGSMLGVRVMVDGVQVGSTITPASINYSDHESSSFTVSAGNRTIRLEGYNPAGLDNSVFIDQLKVVTP